MESKRLPAFLLVIAIFLQSCTPCAMLLTYSFKPSNTNEKAETVSVSKNGVHVDMHAWHHHYKKVNGLGLHVKIRNESNDTIIVYNRSFSVNSPKLDFDAHEHWVQQPVTSSKEPFPGFVHWNAPKKYDYVQLTNWPVSPGDSVIIHCNYSNHERSTEKKFIDKMSNVKIFLTVDSISMKERLISFGEYELTVK